MNRILFETRDKMYAMTTWNLLERPGIHHYRFGQSARLLVVSVNEWHLGTNNTPCAIWICGWNPYFSYILYSASSPFLAPAFVTSAFTLAYISTYASALTTDAFATGWDHWRYLCTNSGVSLAADPIPVWTIAEEDVASKPHPFVGH